MILDNTFLRRGAQAPPCQPDAVQLAAIHDRSWVAGPGPRAVVWVAGCLRRCPGCLNRPLRSFRAGELVSVASLAERIAALPKLRGLTYSGGEPFEQALPLARLSRKLRRCGLSIAAYSGYTLEALRQAPERFSPLLDELDVLIDGEYRQDVPANSPFAGSGNQKIHLLTSRALADGWGQPAAPEIEISVVGDHLSLTGFSVATNALLMERLRSRGVLLINGPSDDSTISR